MYGSRSGDLQMFDVHDDDDDIVEQQKYSAVLMRFLVGVNLFSLKPNKLREKPRQAPRERRTG